MIDLINIKQNKMIEVYEDDVLDKLYFLECRIPTIDEIRKHYNKQNPSEILNNIKINISKIEHKIPLYDKYTENIYLIGKKNVYERVIHQHYRFPEKTLINEVIAEKQSLQTKIQDENITDKIELRKLRKYMLLIEFMESFDLDVLYNTYLKVFYKYSDFVGRNITICQNPSFMNQYYHLKPYLKKNEVINLALNMNLTPNKNIDDITDGELYKLCKTITKYQINADILLKHQNHILESNILGLAQYYTLQGSFFMNQYLRNMTAYRHKNNYLEELIKPMWKLVLTAPAFDKRYTLYRFVKEDSYLQHIKINDIFTESGFMSTTRDPFYRSDLYKFGFILIKINVPADVIGVALCVESISHFPEEQEIIFPPKAKFKLIKKDEDCVYYHTDVSFSSKVKTRYEFDWVENGNMIFERSEQNVIYHTVDFLAEKKPKLYTLNEKLKYFENNYVNNMYQFKVKFDDDEFIVMTEWFDSIGAYNKFYALETDIGYSFYTLYKGYILFFIEIGENDDGVQMHINYYVKYSSVDPSKIIGDDKLINFFSSIAYYFDIPFVVLYANYMNCINHNNIDVYNQMGGRIQRSFSEKTKNKVNKNVVHFNGSYCTDLYQYLKDGIKKYANVEILHLELHPKFSYYDLDALRKNSVMKILKKDDRDEIYQLYDKIYKSSGKDTIFDFMEWLKDNKCYLIELYVTKIDRLLGDSNPFKNDYYILDAMTYLYNRKKIKIYPVNMKINHNVKRSILNDNKNMYRKDD